MFLPLHSHTSIHQSQQDLGVNFPFEVLTDMVPRVRSAHDSQPIHIYRQINA